MRSCGVKRKSLRKTRERNMPISPRDYPMTLEEIAEAMNSNKKAVAMVIATALRKIRRRDGSLVQFRQLVELRRKCANRESYLRSEEHTSELQSLRHLV